MIVSGGSIRRDQSHPTMQPGYYYNNLPEHIKERLKNELTSEIIKTSVLSLFLRCGPIHAWWDESVHIQRLQEMLREEKLKFEAKMIEAGWKPY